MNEVGPRITRDADWEALYEQLTGVVLVLVLLIDRHDRNRPQRAIRLLALKQLAEDTKEAADLAAYLHARAHEGMEPT